MIHKIRKIVSSSQHNDTFAIAEYEKRVVIWSYTNNIPVADFETILDSGEERFAISSDGNFLICANYYLGVAKYDKCGVPLWMNKTVRKIDGVKLLDGDSLYITTENKVCRLNIENGKIIHEYPKFNEIYSGSNKSEILLGFDGQFHLFEISLNQTLKIISIDQDFPTLDVKLIEGHLYVSKNNSTIECYSISTGKRKWKIQAPENENYIKLGYDKNVDILYGILKKYGKERKELLLQQIEPVNGKILNNFKLDLSYEVDFRNEYKEVITTLGNVFNTFSGSIIKTFTFSNWWQ